MTTTPPAIFAFAHPDDACLAAAVPIAEHVAAGIDVNVLWLTDGTTSGVLGWLNGSGTSSWWGVPHYPADEGYDPLTPEEFGAVRIAEEATALKCLSAGVGTITTHRAGLISDSVTAADVKDAIRAVADEIAPGNPVWVKTHTYLTAMEAHPDHLAAGNAARQLATEDARFASPRFYVESNFWSVTPPAGTSMHWDTPANADVKNRAINAYRSFGAWSPPEKFAVGWHSTATLFATGTANPKSMYHT